MKVSAPPPRNLAQEGRETLQAQIDLAPQLYAAEAKYGPLYTDLEIQNLRRSLLGDQGHPGLLSLLETTTPAISRLTAAQSRGQREADIADVSSLGPRALESLRAADPAQAALMDELTSQARAELSAGAGLDPGLRRELQQHVRAGQAARGLGLGPMDTFEEAFTLGQAGVDLRNQRRNFAGNVLGLRSQLYGDPFLQILGRPSVNTAQSNLLSTQGQSLAAGAGPQQFDPFSAYASDLYNTNYNAEANARAATANNRSALAGGFLGLAGRLGGGFLAGRG